jgi:thiol:disulfide interchange protein DsbD
MRKLLLLITAFLFFIHGKAQILDPVKWKSSIEKKSNQSYLLHFDAVIEKEWHMYSQFTADGGALPIEIDFKNQSGNYKLVGKAKESKTNTTFNDVFGVNETYFENIGL